jgi:hypothetical protein
MVSRSIYNNTTILLVVSIVIASLIVDTLLVKISVLNPIQSDPSSRIAGFTVIAIVYVIGEILVLVFVNHKSKAIMMKEKLHLKSIYKIIVIVQSVLTAILVYVLVQMVITSRYDIIMLIAAMTISYSLASTMLGLFAQRFFSWFRSNKNGVLLLYGLSSAILSVNSIFTLVFVDYILFSKPTEVLPYVATNPPFFIPGSIVTILYSTYIISSVIAFIVTWVATAVLLRQYSRKLGRIKYWILVSLPLVYFLSQFVSLSLNLFASFVSSNPIFYGILLSVIFTIGKAAGGILFGVAFWTVARSIPQNNIVRDYMIVSAFGFALLFVSNQDIVLANAFYPPFGLATASFLGLSSYLILVGIYSSAMSVSEDSILRQSIRDFARKESRLLDSIGMAQMEQEIQKKVIDFTKRNQERIAEETGIQSSLSEEDVKEYLQQVIEEVKKDRRKP